ncbi:MAG: NblA/ycf18 family protein [Waterburya sp.]
MLPEFPNFSLELSLSLEQEFTMKTFEQSVQSMDSEDMRSLLLEASKLLMVKDNIIKGLMKKAV